jgi:galactose mutarotase-like enzyme
MRLVRLRSGELEAAFAPEAGMVGCSLTTAARSCSGSARGSRSTPAAGSTFGIPFLHPWANRLSAFGYAVGGQEVALDRDSPLLRIEEHGLPIHGLRAERAGVGGRGARGRAARDHRVRRRAARGVPVPAPPGARRHARRGRADAGDDADADQRHPGADQLRLPPVPGRARRAAREWEVDLPVERRLLLDENLVPTGEGETPAFRHGVLEDRSLDDAYELPERPRPFTVSAAGRTLGVEFLEGYTHAQAFAPAGQDLICFEPMTAPGPTR